MDFHSGTAPPGTGLIARPRLPGLFSAGLDCAFQACILGKKLRKRTPNRVARGEDAHGWARGGVATAHAGGNGRRAAERGPYEGPRRSGSGRLPRRFAFGAAAHLARSRGFRDHTGAWRPLQGRRPAGRPRVRETRIALSGVWERSWRPGGRGSSSRERASSTWGRTSVSTPCTPRSSPGPGDESWPLNRTRTVPVCCGWRLLAAFRRGAGAGGGGGPVGPRRDARLLRPGESRELGSEIHPFRGGDAPAARARSRAEVLRGSRAAVGRSTSATCRSIS